MPEDNDPRNELHKSIKGDALPITKSSDERSQLIIKEIWRDLVDHKKEYDFSYVLGIYSKDFFEKGLFKEGLNFFALGWQLENKTCSTYMNAFHPYFYDYMTEIKNNKAIEDYNAFSEACFRGEDLKLITKKAASVLNFIKEDNALNTEVYEYFFQFVYEEILKSDVNFLRIVHNVLQPPGIYIPLKYFYDTLQITPQVTDAQKYGVLKNVVTNPLFFENFPPYPWVIDQHDDIIEWLFHYGIKVEDFDFLESFCRKNIKNPRKSAGQLYKIYSATKQYEMALKMLEEYQKHALEEDKKTALIEKIFVYKKLNRSEEEIRTFYNLNKKNIEKALKIAKDNGVIKMRILEILGETENAEKIRHRMQENFMRAFGHQASQRTQSLTQTNVQKEILSKKKPILETVKKESDNKKIYCSLNKNNKKENIIQSLSLEVFENNEVNKPQKISSQRNEPISISTPLQISKDVSRAHKKEIDILQNSLKIKIKTRKNADPQQDTKINKNLSNRKKEKSPETERTKKNLFETLRGTPLKILKELFRPLTEKGVKFRSLKISYYNIQTLFATVPAMELKNHNGGDHLKLTVNNNRKLDSDLGESMHTLVKDVNLDPAALKDIVRMFIAYNIYPEDAKEKALEWIKK